jgi:DNA-directed RNA polymerase specialized sigma24 family protein
MGAQEAILSEPQHEWAADAFRRVAPRLWRAILLYSGSAEVANDAVSEAFTQAMAARHEIREPQAWIWTAAFRIAAGEMAGRSDPVEPPDVPAPDGVDVASLVDLMRALGQVSEMQRRALILHYYMGYSNVEIARILGSTPSSIGVQLFRSARKLRVLLAEEMESR